MRGNGLWFFHTESFCVIRTYSHVHVRIKDQFAYLRNYGIAYFAVKLEKNSIILKALEGRRLPSNFSLGKIPFKEYFEPFQKAKNILMMSKIPLLFRFNLCFFLVCCEEDLP